MPAIAVNMPTRKVPVTRVRKNSHPASVTKMGARFASSVELATEVHMIDQCHTPRSAAKNSPAPAIAQRDPGARPALPRACARPTTRAGARRASCARRRWRPGPCPRGARKSAQRRSRSRRPAGTRTLEWRGDCPLRARSWRGKTCAIRPRRENGVRVSSTLRGQIPIQARCRQQSLAGPRIRALTPVLSERASDPVFREMYSDPVFLVTPLTGNGWPADRRSRHPAWQGARPREGAVALGHLDHQSLAAVGEFHVAGERDPRRRALRPVEQQPLHLTVEDALAQRPVAERKSTTLRRRGSRGSTCTAS